MVKNQLCVGVFICLLAKDDYRLSKIKENHGQVNIFAILF